MKVKTFRANTIREAIESARQELGEDIVLLESVPKNSRDPARITVIADKQLAEKALSQQETREVGHAAPAYGRSAYTRHARADAEEESAGSGARFPTGKPSANNDVELLELSPEIEALRREREKNTNGRSRRNLFNSAGNGVPRFRSTADNPEEEVAISEELSLMRERLSLVEKRIGHSIVGTGVRWMAHPLFAELLNSGMRNETASRIFSQLAERGDLSETKQEELKWAVAQELRRLIDLPVPRFHSSPIAFIGPAGSGKTSLILKLASHASFFGKRATTVLSILPESEDEELYHNPTELFRQFGIPVQTVRNETEMADALQRTEHFDQVLIDTQPISLKGRQSNRSLIRLKRVLEPLVPLEVHLAMNTTRALDEFDRQAIRTLPLEPDCVALTHLDESAGWGRIAEWIITIRKPTRFVSINRRVPDGLAAFSPSWFIEEMMHL